MKRNKVLITSVFIFIVLLIAVTFIFSGRNSVSLSAHNPAETSGASSKEASHEHGPDCEHEAAHPHEDGHKHEEGEEHGDDGDGHNHSKESASAQPLKGIVSVKVSHGDSLDTVIAPGTIAPASAASFKVTCSAEGKIVRFLADIGDVVNAGDVLAEISSLELMKCQAEYIKAVNSLADSKVQSDAENFRIRSGDVSLKRYEESKSQLLEAEKTASAAQAEFERAKVEEKQCLVRLNRAKELYADQIISRQDFETAQHEHSRDHSSLVSAELTLKKAREQELIAVKGFEREEAFYKNRYADKVASQSAKSSLNTAIAEKQSSANQIKLLGGVPGDTSGLVYLTSPISGEISARDFSQGQTVSSSDVIFTVANLSSVIVETKVYEKDIAAVFKGQTAEIRSSSTGTKVFNGKVLSVGNTMDPSTGSFPVKIAVLNPGRELKAGTFVKSSIIIARRGGAILVPSVAVMDEDGHKIVFARCSGESNFEKIEVKLGSLSGDKVEVLSGLCADDEVVVEGQSQLKTSFGNVELKAGCSDGCGGH